MSDIQIIVACFALAVLAALALGILIGRRRECPTCRRLEDLTADEPGWLMPTQEMPRYTLPERSILAKPSAETLARWYRGEQL